MSKFRVMCYFSSQKKSKFMRHSNGDTCVHTTMSVSCHGDFSPVSHLDRTFQSNGLLDGINSASGLVRDIAQCDVCFVSRIINNTIHICLHTKLSFLVEIITVNIFSASIKSSILWKADAEFFDSDNVQYSSS